MPVDLKTSRGPGITAVRLFTDNGEIALTRTDGKVATFSIPGQPDRPVALRRRDPAELLSEELRRLDPDDVYAETLRCLVERQHQPAGKAATGAKKRPAAAKKQAAPARKQSAAAGKQPAAGRTTKSVAKAGSRGAAKAGTRKATG